MANLKYKSNGATPREALQAEGTNACRPVKESEIAGASRPVNVLEGAGAFRPLNVGLRKVRPLGPDRHNPDDGR